jgi:hypothetical protein
MWTSEMNDFTKEELQIILLDMKTYINKAGVLKVPEHHLALADKIQTMIDAPCKHEDDGNFYYTSPPQYHCKKCGKFYL